MATKKHDPSLDLGNALAGIEAPATEGETEAVEISAGFFHRTLARWLGLPEGKQPARKKDAAPLWDYDFWKAELVDDGFGDDDKHRYSARIYRAATRPPELYRYWVRIDGSGRIRASGWMTSPPNLMHSASAFMSAEAISIDERDARRLFADEDV